MKNMLFAIVTFIITLIFIECVLRIYAPKYNSDILQSYEYDPKLGYNLRAQIHLFKTTDHQIEIKVNGIKTVNYQEDFDDYKCSIFTLGDSYTQGSGLPADMSYPFQLDLSLNQNSNGFYSKHYAVVNLGVAGYGGEQSLLRLKHYAKLIGFPSIVLYLGTDNDYEDDMLFKSGYRHKHIVANNPYWKWTVRPLQWLTDDLQIGRVVKVAISTVRRHIISKHSDPVQTNPTTPAEREQDVLDKLVSTCNANNAFLVVSWINPTQSYDWVKSWSAQNGIAFADWVPKAKLIQSSMPTLSTENNHSGGHMRGWVNRIIAEEFASHINAH